MEKKTKKKDAEPEMGYCPLSIRQGAGQGAQGRAGGGMRRWGAHKGVTRGSVGARPGRAAGLWAVHLVHSACF